MRYFERKKARIEIIPMIDIVFFLLVFFVMITLRMIPAAGIASQLPQSRSAENLPHPKLVVTLEADGHVEVDGQTLGLDALTVRLRGEPDHATLAVTIAGAKSASLQSLIAVMDACRDAGVTQVGVAAQPAH
ncbi:biopolymer transport protein ExbD [mine drainage metagenome]|uniref:Biopolymer transport protein ExbD n=1 Tax=mine drainage metagenome TaxID=410659 RepID=A0A1J5REH3_9ZZZZ